MSKSAANVKRRRKRMKVRQQATVHGAQHLTMRSNKGQGEVHASWGKEEPHKQTAPRKAPNLSTSQQNKAAKEDKAVVKAAVTPVANNAQKEKNKGWKLTLQQYITMINQAEIEQHGQRVSECTADELHNKRLQERLHRQRERDSFRSAQIAGSEMKAEILSVSELEQEVIINVKFHLTRKISQDGKQYVEERTDQERLWLSKDGQNWQITRVEPIVPERKPRYGGNAQDWPLQYEGTEEEEPLVTRPYLNPDLMSSFRYIRATNRYLREQAVAYADTWWNKPNPSYEEFEANCTNYVSQCLFAGKAPMLYTNRRDSGWWYKGRGQKGKEWWSYSWAVSRSLAAFLSKERSSGLRATEVERADQLQLGDVIVYDWNGTNSFQHTTIVTAFDSKGQPLVNANTNASRHRYWDYQDSYAWTPNTRYRFFHISDLM